MVWSKTTDALTAEPWGLQKVEDLAYSTSDGASRRILSVVGLSSYNNPRVIGGEIAETHIHKTQYVQMYTDTYMYIHFVLEDTISHTMGCPEGRGNVKWGWHRRGQMPQCPGMEDVVRLPQVPS